MARFDGPTTAVTFLIGLGVGAVTALLLAPKAGDELRGNIADGFNDHVAQARNGVKKIGRRAQAFVDQAHGQIQDAVDAGEQAYNVAAKKA
jgi:gas vesicle protein